MKKISQTEIQDLMALHQRGLDDDVISKASSLVKEHPEEIILFNLLGVSYERKGSLKNAAEAYKNALNINPNMDYEYLHGQLNSLLVNESDAIIYSNNTTSTTRQDNIFRNIVAHKLTITIGSNIIISGSESIVYSNRNFDFHYLPFIAFFTMKDYLGDKDNLQLNADIKFIFNNKNYIYAGLYVNNEKSLKRPEIFTLNNGHEMEDRYFKF